MGPLLLTVVELVQTVIGLYIWLFIINAIISWLSAFNVINTRNRVVYMLMDVSYRLTEPVLRPIRNILPDLGGIDISPVVAILLLGAVSRLIGRYAYSLALS